MLNSASTGANAMGRYGKSGRAEGKVKWVGFLGVCIGRFGN